MILFKRFKSLLATFVRAKEKNPMKKLTLILAFTFILATMFSCKSHQRCAAYSKADVETAKEPC